MLLVTFHGGPTGTNNIWGFSTHGQPSDQPPQTRNALSVPAGVTLDELRGMAVWGGNLFVVNGGGSSSGVLVFKSPPGKGPLFTYLDTVIAEGQSIMHPFGIAFDSSQLPANCFVSNQDSNVVARVGLTAGPNGQINGALGSGCVSTYLQTQYPKAPFLNGTFVASQFGDLKGAKATPVSQTNGGLGVTCRTGACKAKTNDQPANSVRDVAIANGILFVCDEVDSQVNMYDLSNGTPLPPGTATGLKSPTHLSVNNKGLWVSADEGLYWSALPASATGASLSLQSVAINVPAKNKIGGLAFDDSGNVYVVFQDGTGGKGTGSIVKYSVTAGLPPTLSLPGIAFATLTQDTPEFCLWISDSQWPT